MKPSHIIIVLIAILVVLVVELFRGDRYSVTRPTSLLEAEGPAAIEIIQQKDVGNGSILSVVRIMDYHFLTLSHGQFKSVPYEVGKEWVEWSAFKGEKQSEARSKKVHQ